MNFTKNEILDLLKSTGMISLIFGVMLFRNSPNSGIVAFLYAILFALIAVGTAFVLHEMAHKFVAHKFNCHTEYKATMKYLFASVILYVLFGFIFLAPGAVHISNIKSKKEYGLISLAGPMMNLILSVVFLGTYFILPNIISFYGFFINAWLALFNLLPIGNLDGKKVLNWNRKIYFMTMASALIIFSVQYAF